MPSTFEEQITGIWIDFIAGTGGLTLEKSWMKTPSHTFLYAFISFKRRIYKSLIIHKQEIIELSVLTVNIEIRASMNDEKSRPILFYVPSLALN